MIRLRGSSFCSRLMHVSCIVPGQFIHAQFLSMLINYSQPLKQKQIKNMEVRPPPLDEELKHLFTKTLVRDDMVAGLALVGDSYDYLTSLPRTIYNEMVTKGLQIRMYTPNQRRVTICHESGDNKSFKLLKNDWAAIVKESGFEVGDKIACWACCHDLGGNFSLLIEKVPSDIECGR